MNEKQRRLVGIAAFFVALLCCNNHIFQLPDFLAGFITGLAIVLLILSMLPDKAWEKLRRWKHRGQ